MLGDALPQPHLQGFLGELVRDREEDGVLDQGEGPGQRQPGPVAGRELAGRQSLKGAGPSRSQVLTVHAQDPSPVLSCLSDDLLSHASSTELSTCCAHTMAAVCKERVPVHELAPAAPVDGAGPVLRLTDGEGRSYRSTVESYRWWSRVPVCRSYMAGPLCGGPDAALDSI